MNVLLVDTGAANVASVICALERVGATVSRSRSPEAVARAERVVLPGVGAFGAVRRRLPASLASALVRRVREGRPTLGICLGMQLFAQSSEESPEVAGLGVVDSRASRFVGDVAIPQLGWNGVQPSPRSRWIRPGAAYFANSYRLSSSPDDWIAAQTVHGEPFIAALERGDVLLCQFHPELSGAWGLDLLARWVDGRPAGGLSCPAPAALTRRIIPCLDIRAGRVVKGIRFQGLRDTGDPAELAEAYADQGADEICLLDVSATPEGRSAALETVARVRARVAIPLTVGGGVQGVGDAQRLLDAGADKIGVNTAAVSEPALLSHMADRLGSQCVVLAVDAARCGASWEVVTRSGRQRTGRDALAWCREGQRRGAGEILLTSWDRDGTRQGYDLALVRSVSASVRVPVIASGGAASAADLAEAFDAGAGAALAASVFHDGDMTVADVKRALSRRGIAVRTVETVRTGEFA